MTMFEYLMNENYFENLMMMMRIDNEDFDCKVWEYLHRLMLMNIVYDVIESDRNDERLATMKK